MLQSVFAFISLFQPVLKLILLMRVILKYSEVCMGKLIDSILFRDLAFLSLNPRWADGRNDHFSSWVEHFREF